MPTEDVTEKVDVLHASMHPTTGVLKMQMDQKATVGAVDRHIKPLPPAGTVMLMQGPSKAQAECPAVFSAKLINLVSGARVTGPLPRHVAGPSGRRAHRYLEQAPDYRAGG
ncbi:hypothetical protein GCM10023328_38940 [Modestobacter marinus]|uniref:Uncharacterized protein n=1 Tax=Modestobacter marinus TaxID=477641 RepID=A0ABQ2G5U5_9ACTN|nr:hypothetical protein GCM10011589_35630 [Modestobacter marinus]